MLAFIALLLGAIVALAVIASGKDAPTQRNLFAVIGLLVGLLGGGGVGSVFIAQPAADQAAEEVEEQVRDEINSATP